MTWSEWLAARHLIFEETWGVHMRASDNQKSAEYRRSVARLKRQP